MKLQQLREEIYKIWEFIHWMTDATPIPENFKAEVKQYGDLRYKKTWVKALAVFEAIILDYSGIDNPMMLHLYFCQPCDEVLAEYNDEILTEFLKLPTALDRIKNGLEILYWQPCDESDRTDALEFLKRLSGYEELRDELPDLGANSNQKTFAL